MRSTTSPVHFYLAVYVAQANTFAVTTSADWFGTPIIVAKYVQATTSAVLIEG